METVHGRTFQSECVVLDDKAFVDCAFLDCVLEYSGGSLLLQRTQLSGCRHVFFGPARGTIHLLQTVGMLAEASGEWQEVPELVH